MSNQDQVYTSYIKTTPQKLWDAITNPEFARQYWGGNANFSDWKKGSKWSHEDAAKKVYCEGEVLESQPPKRLVISWADPGDTVDVSRVTFEIEPVSDLVRLIVTHSGFKAGSTMPGRVSNGWPLVLSSMKSFLETGKPIDIMAVKGPCGTPDGQAAA
jgi:uncharacterized protein YndB with AHSA1/START domain